MPFEHSSRSSRRDKSNPMFSARQPLEQWLPSRHPSNKTSSNHDPSPPRKPPCTAQSTKAYINVMRPWPGLPHQSSPHPDQLLLPQFVHHSFSLALLFGHVYVSTFYRQARKLCPMQANPTDLTTVTEQSDQLIRFVQLLHGDALCHCIFNRDVMFCFTHSTEFRESSDSEAGSSDRSKRKLRNSILKLSKIKIKIIEI